MSLKPLTPADDGLKPPAAIRAYRLATGQIRQPGVIFPEALDPKPVLAELAGYGVKWEERLERS